MDTTTTTILTNPPPPSTISPPTSTTPTPTTKPPLRTPHSLPHSHHILQNTLLILLSLLLLPFTTLLVLIPNLQLHPPPPPQPRLTADETVLITNTTMTKGLTLCRAFKKCGWRVVGADIVHGRSPGDVGGGEGETDGVGKKVLRKLFGWVEWSPGRMSRAVDRYCEFPDPAWVSPEEAVGKEEREKERKGRTGPPGAGGGDGSVNPPSGISTDMDNRLMPTTNNTSANQRSFSPPQPIPANSTSHLAAIEKGKQRCFSPPHLPLKPHTRPPPRPPVQPTITTPAVTAYANSILALLSEEKIQLWIHVSSVSSTIEEAQAAIIVANTLRQQAKDQGKDPEQVTKIIQLPPTISSILHEKDTFIDFTKALGFRVPKSLVCRNEKEVMDFLYPDTMKSKSEAAKRYILKCIPLDDISRADLTLYPFPTKEATQAAIAKLKISDEKPFLLQEFIDGEEYTTHGVISNGKLMSFTACLSSELLMHYLPMDPKSAEFRAMKEFTERYIAEMIKRGTEGAENMSGQMSFDFLVKRNAETDEVELYPIECNPRTHTAVILFSHEPRAIANAYLGHFPSNPDRVSPNPKGARLGYYWAGHDLVTMVLLPFKDMILQPRRFREFLQGTREFLTHLLWWKDPMFETWDPLPWWWMYHVYWPGVFIMCLLTGRKWSRVNVSTGRVFETD